MRIFHHHSHPLVTCHHSQCTHHICFSHELENLQTTMDRYLRRSYASEKLNPIWQSSSCTGTMSCLHHHYKCQMEFFTWNECVYNCFNSGRRRAVVAREWKKGKKRKVLWRQREFIHKTFLHLFTFSIYRQHKMPSLKTSFTHSIPSLLPSMLWIWTLRKCIWQLYLNVVLYSGSSQTSTLHSSYFFVSHTKLSNSIFFHCLSFIDGQICFSSLY